MIRRICLSAAALVMLAAPAFAAAVDAACKEPVEPPAMPDGKTAPAKDIIAAANSVKAYVADSDAYLFCYKQAVDKIVDDAKKAKAVVDPKIRADLEAKDDVIQMKKDQLGASYAATAAAYRAAHPPAKK